MGGRHLIDFYQLLLGGFVIGCAYALIALGFSMMVRAVNLINFAQGDLAMIGAFVSFTLVSVFHVPYVVSFVIAALVAGLVGLLIERFALRKIIQSRAPNLNLVIAVLGLSFAFRSIAILIWGADPLAFPSITKQQTILIGSVAIHPLYFWLILLGLTTMLFMHYFFQKTLTGVSWRAASLEPTVARLMGISIKRTNILTFGLSAAVGGAAGVLIGPLYFVSYNMGVMGIKAFAAATLGGFNILGSMLGGIILGVVETFAVRFISPSYKDAIAYGSVIILLMLFYKPAIPPGRQIAEKSKSTFTLSDRIVIPKNIQYILFVIAVAVWIAIPFISSIYVMHILCTSLIFALAALGLQLIIGFTGQMSLGHAAFFGVGAYTSTILMANYGWPFPVTFIIAGLATALIAFIVVPVLRLSGLFLGMATLALGEIIYLLMNNLVDLTEGPYGIHSIPYPSIGIFTFDSYTKFYFLFTIFVALAFLVISRITSFRFGRALIAIRENERAAAASGINIAYYKAVAFVIGCAIAGLAGSLYAHFNSYISPESFNLSVSINYLIMVVIGGLGNLFGAILGAFLVVLAPEYLRFLSVYRTIAFALLIVLFMMYMPGGLSEALQRLFLAVANIKNRILFRSKETPRGSLSKGDS